ncbi:MAG TPA: Ldh family oxidoreductase [Solirubrobacteraceae bacterium]|nr:Ldh family oxidoreductase [Solirubrobacteraceae bacterium]
MDVSIDTLRDLMISALRLRGVTGADAAFVAQDFLDAQLEGKPTHGIGKFLLIDQALKARLGAPETVRQHGATALVDAHRQLGQLAARDATELAITLARQHGVGLVTLRNFSRFGRLEPYGRLITTASCVGIVLNDAGPPAVVPTGAKQALLGTNPVCFAFPDGDEGLVIDFSSAERVWGEIRQAMLEHRPLPAGAFFDADGKPTTDPERAEGVLPFGGHKGYALCLSLELLAGTLTATAVGGSVHDEYDLGAVFLAAAPELITGSTDASALASGLAHEIRELPPQPGLSSVLIPGDKARDTRRRNVAEGRVSIDDGALRGLEQMSKSADAVLASTNKTN